MKLSLETEPDYERSPFTGWTREHFVEIAERMIVAIQAYVTPGKGGVALPNPVRWMDAFLPKCESMESFYWMEGYSRTRLLIVCWMIGTGKNILNIDGKEIDIADQFIEGLLSVSDPDHPEYIGDRYGNDQYIAETSAISLAIYMARELIWAKMSSKEKQQILDWIFSTTGKYIPPNNWNLFLANTHLVLKALGGKYNQEELDNCMEKVKSFDLGDGWFLDGDESRGHSIDQYNAWGFHYFLPAFVHMGGLDSGTNEWIIDRLQKFIKSYSRFFSSNGSIPMWGRSWAYRPALTSPFIWAEILGVSPLSHGESRRIVSGQLKYYYENDYFYENMAPTMGYVGENLELIEPYSQYGSPYWGGSVFMSLLLSSQHAFWREAEKPCLVERESYCISEPQIGMLVAGNQDSGEVQLINHRAWHQKEGRNTKYAKKYSNFVYSSHFGLDLRRNENGYNCDNMFAVSPDGVRFSQRIIPHFICLEEKYGVSTYYPLAGFPFDNEEDSTVFSADAITDSKEDQSVKVTTHSFLKNFCHLRIHILESEKKLKAVREGGFALNYTKGFPETKSHNDAIGFFDGKRGTFIKALLGYSGIEDPTKNENFENSNTLGGCSVTPILLGGELAAGKHLFISLSGTWFDEITTMDDLLKTVSSIQVRDSSVAVTFFDGEHKVFEI